VHGAAEFETARLIGRRLAAADAAAMHAVYGHAEGMRWVGDGRPLTRERCERWIEITQRNYAQRGYGMYALVERASGAVIGFCGLVHPDGQADAEIKYALHADAWGRGYATEAARALLAYGRDVHGLRRVIATAAPEHAVSHRVLLKAGLRMGALRRNDDGSSTQLFDWAGDP